MLTIENYKRIEGLKFGEWTCGIAAEHHPVYRFSFHKGEYTNGRWTQTFWIEVNRTVFTDSDGDNVVSIHFPGKKLDTRMSIEYMRRSYNVIKNFSKIIEQNAGQ